MHRTSLSRVVFFITIAGSMLGAASASPRALVAQPSPDSAPSLTLEQALAYADVNAPAVRLAQARVGRADAEVAGAKIALPANPQVSFGAGGRSVGGAAGFEFEVAVQQQLEVAGEPGLRLGAARARRRLSEAEVREVQWSVHVEVHRLFVALLLAQERRAQAERFVAFARSMRDIASRQVEAGESSPLVLLVADADLAQTREAVIEAERVGAALEARLIGVMGWPGAALPAARGALPEIKRAPDADALLARMTAHHPSLRARELAVIEGRRRVELEEREAWPEPAVGVAYGREAAPGSGPEAHVWLVSVAVPLPLWRTNRAGRAEAKAKLDVADRAREATAARLRAELTQAAVALNAAVARVRLYETGIVPQLEANLMLLERAYALGEADIHQVSQTRARLLAATGQHIDARITYYATAATLEGLVGTELWPKTEDTP